MLFLTLIKGVAVGIVIALPVGPVGVLCVRRNIFEGARFGFVSGLGAASADAFFAIIAGFGFTFIRDWLLLYADWLGAIGGLFLLAIGLKALFTRNPAAPEPLGGERLLGAYASTFALTVANPITILSFAAIFAELGLKAVVGWIDISLLVAGVFLGSSLWWLGLSLGVSALRKFARTFQLIWLNRISGSILSLSGVALLVVAIVGLLRSFA
jgi:threonine/homoserine/homoserine lactone efflux protein